MAPKNQTTINELSSASARNSKPVKSKKTLVTIMAILLLALGAAAAYFYSEYLNLKTDPNEKAQAEVEDLILQVSKIMVLPEDEKPTIATVTDVERLRSQSFFANAQNGYKVLIYTRSKKAILFDPESNKIIEVAPIDIGGGASSTPNPEPVVEKSTNEASEPDTTSTQSAN